LGDNKAVFNVPAKPEDYQYKAPQMPEGFEWDKDLEAAGRKFAHERNLPPELFQEFGDFIAQAQIGAYQRMKSYAAEDETKMQADLKQQWGKDLDRNVEIAQFAGRELKLEPELLNKLNAEIGSPALVRLMHKIGQTMKGAEVITGDGASGSAQGAMAEIAQLESDPAFQKAFNDKNDPGHAAAVSRHEKAMARAYPSGT
jgi:hypothetical protein